MSNVSVVKDYNRAVEQADRFEQLFGENSLDKKSYCLNTVIRTAVKKLLSPLYCIYPLKQGTGQGYLPYLFVRKDALSSPTNITVPSLWAPIVVGLGGKNVNGFMEKYGVRLNVVSSTEKYGTDRDR
jgi:hypothetical protein